MKICIAADLHLPYINGTAQSAAFEYMLSDAQKKGAELLVFAGDITADGDEKATECFFEKVNSVGIPFLVILGNSDCRRGNPKLIAASEYVNRYEKFKIFMLNDGERKLSDEELDALKTAESNDIVFMHHPPEAFKEPFKAQFAQWREENADVTVFCAHLHKFGINGSTMSLPALDPDKNIGESSCFVYYDTDSRQLEKAYYFCPMPTDFHKHTGISCYKPIEHLRLSAEHGMKSVELRPNAISADRTELVKAVEKWRNAGGENLSIHFPDAKLTEDGITGKEKMLEFSALVHELKADRVTIHVPRMYSHEADEKTLEAFAELYAEVINSLPENCVTGIENLHMKEEDRQNGTRPFGCVPEDCTDFVERIRIRTDRKVGINFDLGHARNNAPYSQKYTLGAWYAEVGKYCVGYHIHQVTGNDGTFENHSAVTENYGRLISLASFYDGLYSGTLNYAPFIFEIRVDGGAEKTIAFFEEQKKIRNHDIHSHTRYSRCGRDEPQKLVDTAVRNGISVLGICDHSYGIGERKRTYLAEMRQLAEKNRDRIKIICGIEIPSLPHVYDFRDGDFSVIADYDYCLIEHIDEPESVVADRLIEFAEQVKIPCGIAHTDMFRYCRMFDRDPEAYFRELAAKGIFWEMNMSYDSIHRYRKHAYVERFFNDEEEQRIVREAGLKIAVGFDSHRCEDYDGERVSTANELLRKLNIQTVDGYLF